MEDYKIKPSKRSRLADTKLFSPNYGISAQRKEIYVEGSLGRSDYDSLSIEDLGGVSVKGGGPSNLGIGDLIFKSKAGIEVLKWENVSSPGTRRSEVENYIKKLINDEQDNVRTSSSKESEHTLPTHENKRINSKIENNNVLKEIKYTDKVIVVPLIDHFLGCSFYSLRADNSNRWWGGYGNPYAKFGSWVNKGDKIAQLNIRSRMFFGEQFEINFYSPTTGRIIYKSNAPFGETPSSYRQTNPAYSCFNDNTNGFFGLISIQVAEKGINSFNEEYSMDIHSVYGELIAFCNNRPDILLKGLRKYGYYKDVENKLNILINNLHEGKIALQDVQNKRYNNVIEEIEKDYGGLRIDK